MPAKLNNLKVWERMKIQSKFWTYCATGCCLLFISAAYIQVHFRLDFSWKNDQIALKSDLGPYCLQYRLPNKGADNKSHD